jgi:hypothetical protein
MKRITIVFLITAFWLAMAGGASAQEVSSCSSSEVSYWKFDEGTGTTAVDSTGTNDGVISGATWIDGQVGGALSFDGNDWIEIPDSASLNWDTMSVEFWMKGAASQPDRNRYLVIDKKHGFVTPYSGWVMQGISWSGRLQWGICYYSGGNRCVLASTAASMLDETWHHVVGTYDGNTLSIYVDGVLEGSAQYSNIGTWKNDRNVEIGRSWHGGSYPHRYFRGQLDEMAIYDKALAPEDIKQHYQNGLKGLPYCPSITVAVDIAPDTINLKSRGKWITAYVTLPEGYNVNEIDVSTVTIEDTLPAEHSEIQDGTLMVKFDRNDVIDLLNPLDLAFSTIDAEGTIEISGELTDGTPFKGSDTIRVISKGGGK